MIQKLTRKFFSAFFQFFHRMKKWRWGFFCHLIKRHLAEIASPSSTSLSHLLRFRETASTLQNDLMTWVKEKWTNRGERRKIEGSQKYFMNFFLIVDKHCCDAMTPGSTTRAVSRTVRLAACAFLLGLAVPGSVSVEDVARSKSCLATVETVLEHNSPELLVIPNEDELSIFTSNRVHISVT